MKQECLSTLILFSEASLKRVAAEYLAHSHADETIRASTTSGSSLALLTSLLAVHRSSATNVSADSFATMHGLHGCFDKRGLTMTRLR